MSAKSPDQPRLFIGIDWADRQHEVCSFSENRPEQMAHQSLDQQPEAIAQWVAALQTDYPDHRLLVALEQSRGPLTAALKRFPQLELFPLNPSQLASYRRAVCPSGSKNDPGDAALIAQFLQHHHSQLRPRQDQAPETARIAELVELRRKLVEERKRLTLRLGSSLKGYFPLALTLTGRALHDEIVLDLLRRWPTLPQLKRAHPKTLRTFLAQHGLKNTDRQTRLIETLRAATPLTKDPALIKPQCRYVQCLVQQLRDLNQAIAGFDEQLQRLAAAHPDHELFRSLPGAGAALAPRLLAAFGSDRDRYDRPEQLQCYSGIAPVTQQSGKKRTVRKRRACPKFLRQTFHEFADQARKWSPWSKAFYTMKRHQGFKHHAAVRALAYKWIRIIFHLWKTHSTYSEQHYIQQLRRTHSPVIEFLEPAKSA